jgi:hypothetical protein
MATNEPTQSEKREVLKDSYFARQQNTADDAGGRFTKLTPTNVTGSTPVPSYPQQPPNSPWHHDPIPATEPLGMSVDAMEPNGTPEEVEKSIQSDNSDRSSSATVSPSVDKEMMPCPLFSEDNK